MYSSSLVPTVLAKVGSDHLRDTELLIWLLSVLGPDYSFTMAQLNDLEPADYQRFKQVLMSVNSTYWNPRPAH